MNVRHVLIMIIALSAGALAQTAATPASAGPADAAVRQRLAAFVLKWNAHDPKGMAGFWTADGDLINPFGQVARGRESVEKLLASEQSGIMKDSNFELRVEVVRNLAPDVALVDGTCIIHNMTDAKGQPVVAQRGHVMLVMVNKLDQWLIAAARPGALTRAE